MTTETHDEAQHLADAIRNTAARLGLCSPDAALTGPQLLLLLRDIEGMAKASAAQPLQPAKPPTLYLRPEDEQMLWKTFDADPRHALSLAIGGMRRLYLQDLAHRGAMGTVTAPEPLAPEEVIRLRKSVPLSLKPWGETLGFASLLHSQWTKALQGKLRGEPAAG